MISNLKQVRDDFSLSASVAGFLAVLISYAGPLVIVYQAARLANLSTEQTSSWIWSISIGSGLTGLIIQSGSATGTLDANGSVRTRLGCAADLGL